ncbi:MAG: hypothetical protein AAFS10_10725 [Myxococcota bacterium]
MTDTTSELDILNCAADGIVEFELLCPVQWDNMIETEHANQRFCTTCKRRVYRCINSAEAALRAEQGECIAVPDWLAKGARDARAEELSRLAVGQPRRVGDLFKELAEQRQEQTRC